MAAAAAVPAARLWAAAAAAVRLPGCSSIPRCRPVPASRTRSQQRKHSDRMADGAAPTPLTAYTQFEYMESTLFDARLMRMCSVRRWLSPCSRSAGDWHHKNMLASATCVVFHHLFVTSIYTCMLCKVPMLSLLRIYLLRVRPALGSSLAGTLAAPHLRGSSLEALATLRTGSSQAATPRR